MPRSLPLFLILAACDPSGEAGEGPAGAPGNVDVDVDVVDVDAPKDPRPEITPRAKARTALERALQVHSGTDEPIASVRVAERAMMLYAEPKYSAAFRGKIPHGEAFAVFETIEGGDPECRAPTPGQGNGGWARVGASAFACLESTREDDGTPRVLPGRAKGQLTPFFHARVRRKDKSGNIPLAPRWASRSALDAGAEPIDHLVADHDYAFTRRVRSRHGTLLVDKDRRVVREADVRKLEPSPFAGRDVVARPLTDLPEGGALAWTLLWPFVAVRGAQDPEAEIVSKIQLHTEFYVQGEPVRRRGIDWLAVAGEHPGWVDADEVRRWIPAPRPDDVADDELWIDVELDQQTLGVHVGDELVFVTMIASGNHKHATPRGLFRIYTKMAIADMDSQPGDEEQYAVEGVPWAQFFYKRYGLHGTFWHNRFGRRTSHGCVNLSAKDAALVFSMTTPRVLPGWSIGFGHAEDQGTVVRIRKLADIDVIDRRAWRE
jgi:lipoprotein-anchoring transpeptidase ErfK/SrfK